MRFESRLREKKKKRERAIKKERKEDNYENS